MPDAAAGVGAPTKTGARLGLPDGPCWMIVTEAHIFVWPGPDLRRPENTRDGYVYGSWPHAMMLRIKLGFAAWCVRKGIRAIWRGA